MRSLCWLALWSALTLPVSAYAADAPKIEGPIYAMTHIEVAPDAAQAEIAALRAYRAASLKEPGVTTVDIFQEAGQPSRFILSEIWRDQQALDAHTNGPATATLFDKTKPVQFKPPDMRPHTLFAGTPFKPPVAGHLFVISHLDVFGPGVPVLQAAIKPLTEATLKEPGIVRYEVLDQTVPRANHFRLYEEWDNEKDWVAHNLSQAVRDFYAKLPQYLGTPYDQRVYRLVN